MRYNILTGIIISLYACGSNQPAQNDLLHKENSLITSTIIDAEVSDSITIDIRDISENLQLIRLETSESIVLGNIYSVVLDDNYMIVGTEKDYYLFNREGKYLRRLLEIGRGPDEFLNLHFAKTIRNGVVYFADFIKNKRFIYYIDLASGVQGRIPRATQEQIHCFTPDSDTSLLIVSSTFTQGESPLIITRNLSIIRQDYNGRILSTLVPNIAIETNRTIIANYSLFRNGEDIYISNERFDTLFHVNSDKLEPVWINEFSIDYAYDNSSKKVPAAKLISFLEESLMIERYNLSFKHFSQINAYATSRVDDELIIVDRVEDKLSLINKLFFLDESLPISFSPDIKLDDNQFGISINPSLIEEIINDTRYSDIIEKMLIQDDSFANKPITKNDNPLILVGKYKPYKPNHQN